ncbi:MAG: acyltransferase [Clostridium sp.]|jgi:surface polysaccharide O-acyltransferase-like enzyme|nr:acyltransferase [Clostridium sp.]
MKTKRNVNIECLRVVAMFMVIMLHYLGKGFHLPELTKSFGAVGVIAWILESLSIVAVNVYFLISGFFLSGANPKMKRLLSLICQVLFYSILIALVALTCGLVSPAKITIYDILNWVLPIQMKHYWFATVYVMFYLISPILGVAIRHMSRSQLQVTLFGLLVFCSLGKSVLPVALAVDELGYDLLWFLCVYLAAAYLRLYGLSFFRTVWRGFAGYLLFTAAIFAVAMGARALYFATQTMEDYMKSLYGYNHILNLAAAVSLFYAFYRMKESKIAAWMARIAPYTFGVYLLHEHVLLRYEWPQWVDRLFGDVMSSHVATFVFGAVISCLMVLVVGSCVDWTRVRIFAFVSRRLRHTKFNRLLDRVDQKFT